LNSEATIIFLRMTLLYGGNHWLVQVCVNGIQIYPFLSISEFVLEYFFKTFIPIIRGNFNVF
jgi:hypothetical protein